MKGKIVKIKNARIVIEKIKEDYFISFKCFHENNLKSLANDTSRHYYDFHRVFGNRSYTVKYLKLSDIAFRLLCDCGLKVIHNL